MNREKRTGSLPLELGITPEPAAVSLNVAKEALLMRTPDEAHAMTRAELFKKAGVIINTTRRKALRALLAEKQIPGMGPVHRARLIGTS